MRGVTVSLRSRLLVASPSLTDPNFYRSVVFLIDHDDDGALGVVLNRPTEVSVGDPLPGWDLLAAEPAVVFSGGPVQPVAAVAIGRTAEGVGTLDLNQDPLEAAREVEAVRVFSGYAGWSPGQLEGEIDEGAWIVVDAEPDDVMSEDPEGLWERVLERQPPPVCWLAKAPPHLSFN